MRYKEHLVLSGIINGIFLFILYKVFNVNILQLELIFPLFATVYIFSILPDIDHPYSHASAILSLSLIGLFGFSAYNFYQTLNPLNLLSITLAVGIFIAHLKYAEDSYLHRRFPHTFTFGFITCAILYFLLNSVLITVVGAVSFFTHILSDSHLDQAIEKDQEMWKFVWFKIKESFSGK